MDNKEIVKHLRKMADFMELHGENEFKVRGYSNAVYNIERTTTSLKDLSKGELEKVNGIGKSIASKIYELIDTGKIVDLEDLVRQTPEGVAEMMNIKGLGTKKIRTLWKDVGISGIEELQTAMKEGRLSDLKGFGGKVLESISKAIDFYLVSKFKIYYSTAENIYNEIESKLHKAFPEATISPTGEIRRKMEIIETISMVIGFQSPGKVTAFLNQDPDLSESPSSSPFVWRGHFLDIRPPVKIHLAKPEKYISILFATTGSSSHLNHLIPDQPILRQLLGAGQNFSSEKEIYQSAQLPYIEPELREGLLEFDLAKAKNMPSLITIDDLKGILHCHSHYSDGKHSLREMAEYCKSLGYEYLGISDHSKAATFYANGMDEDRVKQQHDEIDTLNGELAPFKIFKGIEADILPDGMLDYDPEILASFDFVVASIHSVLNMDIQKATDRLLQAVRNPFTTILGHLTGRQLLIREGYPIDHKEIINACADRNVIIEVNAHPKRLDLDWRWIPYALEKNVTLSINPDAHAKEGYHHMYYGVCVARKGGLTPEMNFNSRTTSEVQQHFENRKQAAMVSLKMN